MVRLSLSLALLPVALAADLPVRQVVLYKNGVGYFERAGTLRAGESARLEFKEAEMNDVLKSLTVEDSTGAVKGLRYDSSEPLERKLARYPFALRGENGLVGFFDQLKGARIEVRLAGEVVSGSIVGARMLPGNDKQATREELTLLLDSGELRTVDLSAALRTRLASAELQNQLKEYLAALSQAQSREKRSVYVDSSDAANRSLVASYLIPTPVWKSSYRLIFGQGAEPTLEGWAIVDNTTGEDWTNVQLALISGRPVSFISRLYQPQYRQRVVADLAEEQAEAPRVYQGALGEVQVTAAAPGGVVGGVIGGIAGGMPSAAPPPPPMKKASRAPQTEEVRFGRQDASSGLAVATVGREVGELFEYRFSQPVTVRKSESAMLPFLQQKMPGRKLLIYTTGSPAVNPRHAVEITNRSGKTLDGGPLTVFEASAYAGEGLIETVRTGDKRLIDYAVDLGTRITTAFESGEDVVREIHAVRGVLTARSAVQETTTYTIQNVDQKPKTLLIEQEARPEYQVLSPKPIELTPKARRYEVKLAPGASQTLAVKEEHVFDQTYVLSNVSPDQLLEFRRQRSLPPAGNRQLGQILQVKSQIAGLDEQLAQADQEANRLNQDQERIRRNIGSLAQVSGQQPQVQKYAETLARQEAQLAALHDRASDLRTKRAALQSELNGLLEKVEF